MSFAGAWGFVQARAGNAIALRPAPSIPARICLARTKRAGHGLRRQTWQGWLIIAIYRGSARTEIATANVVLSCQKMPKPQVAGSPSGSHR